MECLSMKTMTEEASVRRICVMMVNVYLLLTVITGTCLCSALPDEDRKVCSTPVTVKRWRVVSESSPETTYTCDDSDDGQHACDHRTRRQPYTSVETRYFCCPGYFEDQYGNCKGCPPGRYGRGCSELCVCPDTAYELCNQVDGACTCTSGWTGSECQSSCQSGTYGAECSQKCSCPENAHATCHHVTGECICKPGWLGGKCEQECESGFYGRDCLSLCSCPATALPGCHHVTGRCQCRDGWTGELCDQPCIDGYFGPNCQKQCSCQNGGSCDHVTGVCKCTVGWHGPQCQAQCESGFYGRDCLSRCSCPATALPGCNHVTGWCRCRDGWTGERCDQPCIDGYFGPNCQNQCTCQNGGLCDHVTGLCQCSAGWHGLECQQLCPNGNYGADCQRKCDCLDAISCNPVDGTCHCLPGIRGEKCDQGCSPWTFGSMCSGSCNCERNTTVVCSPLNGTCLCLFGWTGERCHIQERRIIRDTAQAQFNLPAIVGIGAASIVLLTVGTCLVIFLLKRRSTSYSGWLLPLKTAFCRSMLTNTVILEADRGASLSSVNQDDTGLCAAEAQLTNNDVFSVGIENSLYRYDGEYSDGNTATRSGTSNPADYGATDGYDRLKHNVKVKVTDTGSSNSYDHVHRQLLSVSAPDDHIYDVTSTDDSTTQRRPSSTYYQSLVV